MAVDDAYTKSLLHFNETSGSVLLDENKVTLWDNYGTLTNAQYKFSTGKSNYFGGSGSYVETTTSNIFLLDDGSNSNKWTIDFWVRFNGDPGTARQGFCGWGIGTADSWSLNLNNNTLWFKAVESSVGTISISNAWNPADATWYHVAVVKDGTNGYLMFINGNQIGTTQTDISTIPNVGSLFRIGWVREGAGNNYYFVGWMDEFRISKGITRWTANFTPPTAPYGVFLNSRIVVINA